MSEELSFKNLVGQVKHVHNITSSYAKNAINQLLTVRNWSIGYYIVEFEQNGQDRAEYGTHLLQKLEESLKIKGMNKMLFYKCRAFYLRYPQIFSTVSKKLKNIENVFGLPILPDFSEKNLHPEKFSMTSKKFETEPDILVSRLSFSHIMEIVPIEDPLERFFYEFECIRGNWSVKELRRQITTNLFVRAGISKNPEKLLAQTVNSKQNFMLSIKEPFTFEFLGLDAKDTVTESDIEQALMDHLQEFLLEMGKGFCFEARQKRIVIDGEYYFPDLILYNRILHCNVIIELKNEEFSHENFGQLNAYVAYYKENEMYEGDNPPIGILLCTKKGPKMVEYALSGMDNQLFVSTYMLQLPDKKQLTEFLLRQMEEMGI